jgi:hypothetical protein
MMAHLEQTRRWMMQRSDAALNLLFSIPFQ